MPNGAPQPKPPSGGSIAPGAIKPKPKPSGHGGNTPRPPKPPQYNPNGPDPRGPYRPNAEAIEILQARELANQYLPPEYDDMYGEGRTAAELAMEWWAMQQRNSGHAGGGGSAAPVVSQETINAYKQMLQALQDQSSAEMAGFDQRGTSLATLQGEGDARLRAIMAQLDASRTSAQGSSNQAFIAADQRIAQMADQYAQGAAGRDAGMNRSLNAFGVESLGGQSGGSLQDMLGAVRATNSALQGVNDQAYANRANVHAGLNADAAQAYGRQFTQLQAQLQAQRQQAAIADAQRRAALAIQAAQAGVTL